jgi:SnoaL-like domain
MEQWEVAAREAIRDTMARYTHSGDSAPFLGLADAFCIDGVLEAESQEPVHGRVAIDRFRREARERAGAAQPGHLLRHNVANILFESVSQTEAIVRSYYTVFTELGLDHYGLYRDRFVPVGDQWLIAHKFVTCDWRAETCRF